MPQINQSTQIPMYMDYVTNNLLVLLAVSKYKNYTKKQYNQKMMNLMSFIQFLIIKRTALEWPAKSKLLQKWKEWWLGSQRKG